MGEDNMFRNKKNSEKSERKKAVRAQARQAADEKLQELKVKAEQSPESQAVLRFMNRYSTAVPRAAGLRGVLRHRVGIAAFLP